MHRDQVGHDLWPPRLQNSVALAPDVQDPRPLRLGHGDAPLLVGRLTPTWAWRSSWGLTGNGVDRGLSGAGVSSDRPGVTQVSTGIGAGIQGEPVPGQAFCPSLLARSAV